MPKHEPIERLGWPSLAYPPAEAWWHAGTFYKAYPETEVPPMQHYLIQPLTRHMLQSRRDKGLLLPEWIIDLLDDEEQQSYICSNKEQ